MYCESFKDFACSSTSFVLIEHYVLWIVVILLSDLKETLVLIEHYVLWISNIFSDIYFLQKF